jgi:hypothetical protein
MNFLTSIYSFIKNPKNTRLIIFIGFLALILLLFRQCNQTQKAKEELIRTKNNYEAANDTIRQYKIDDKTTRAEIRGYELTLSELQNEYKDLLGKFNVEKNKPPKTIIEIKYEYIDRIVEVPIYVSKIDSLNRGFLKFSDSAKFDNSNYRYFSGNIPFRVDTTTKPNTFIPSPGTFTFTQGMSLRVGLFQDKKDKKIYIKADTEYPGITFTSLKGASILDDGESKKVAKQLRKQFSLGVSAGYGLMYNIGNSNFSTGPYLGLGINYQPKWLQW